MRNAENIIVNASFNIKGALEILNTTGLTILFLVDSNNKLIRTITDGDIRRLLLDGFSLDDQLENLPPKNYIATDINASPESVLNLMKLNTIDQIPILNNNKEPLGLILKSDLEPRIQLSVPHMSGFELGYIEEAFNSNWIAPLGPNVDGFEREFSDYLGGSYCTAVNSGTSAIHLSLLLLGVSSDDIVLCSSFTFVASANPILYQNATPVFIDSEPTTWNMSPIALEKAIKSSLKIGKKPKAIIVVHLYGQSAKLDEILQISNLYEIPVIEDSAESLGSLYKGRKTGTMGVFGIFSFNGNKIITTSGGGMLVSKDKEMILKAKYLSTQAKDDFEYYEHKEVGYNYRMSNVLAGIGRGQLKVLDKRVQEKREIYEYYKNNLNLDCLEWMPEPNEDYSNRWLSVLRIKSNKTNITASYLIKKLKERNIELRHVWKPMHLQPLFFSSKYFKHTKNSFCDDLFNTCVCLPSSSSMDQELQKIVISEILNVFK